MSPPLGILPCAGQQTRMKELVFSKELLPLFNGKPVIQHSIEALHRATPHIHAAVHPKKKDLIRYLRRNNVKVFIEPHPTGLPTSIAFAAHDHPGPILYALPDAYFEPKNVFKALLKHPQANVLGLFNSGTPERFDSVRTRGDRIIRYAVKVNPPLSPWTMGCGKLAPTTLKFLTQRSSTGESILGDCLQPLVHVTQLYGIKFQPSRYQDLGTPGSYIEYLIHQYPPQHKVPVSL